MGTDFLVVVPSRSRPDAAKALIAAFDDTCTADTSLVFAIDEDDPTCPAYLDAVEDKPSAVDVVVTPGGSMVAALNFAVQDAARSAFAVGFLGDDHRPRTKAWDQSYLDALRGLGRGIVYGDDLLQGARLPTQVAMTSDIVRVLGHMAPGTLRHLYVDNYWLDLGLEANCLEYLPNVVIEHLHPIAGKAQWDEGYVRVNSHAQYDTDRAAYEAYKASGGLAADVAKVRALREAL